MRSTVIALGFLIVSSWASAGQNYAIILGGAAQYIDNEFLPKMSSTADSFVSRGWKTTVLYDSDFDPKEWQRFPASVRPAVPGEAAHQFKLSNFERTVAQILKSKPGPGDQVEIAFTAHGGTFPWGHGISWHDLRGHGELSQVALSLLAPFTQTSSLFKSIENLLKSGTRVHLNTSSCYDGQILKDIKPLLKKYPRLLCVTTSTTSDRESFIAGFPLQNEIFASKSPISILDAFKAVKDQNNQISSIPDWMKIQEKSVSSLTRTQYTHRPEEVGQALCQLQNESAVSPIVLDELREITQLAVTSAAGTVQADCQKLMAACTDVAAQKLANEYSARTREFEKKKQSNPIILKYSDAPDLFHFESRQSAYGQITQCSIHTSRASGWTSHSIEQPNCDKYAIQMKVSDIAEIFLQDDGKLTKQDQRGLKTLRKALKKNPQFERAVTELVQRRTILKNEFERRSCDDKKLNQLLRKIKNSQLDGIRGTEPAKACEDFKI